MTPDRNGIRFNVLRNVLYHTARRRVLERTNRLFNCAVGELCSVVRPSPDGCYSHACEPIPPACVEDPTCTCLLELEPFAECEEDASGNPTIYDEI